MSFNWDDKAVLLLIKHFHENDILWNHRNADYKNRNKRMDALNTIARLFGIHKSEVERKLKNVTSHYFRERKKVVESRKSSASADDVYKPKWYAYDALEFLQGKIKPLKAANSKKANDTSSSITSVAEPQEDVTSSSRKRRYYSDGDNDISQALKVLRDVSASKSVRDDASLFGDYIASKIRKMDRVTTSKVQHRIQNIIYKAEMGNYSRRPSVPNNCAVYLPASTFDDNSRSSTSQSSDSDTKDSLYTLIQKTAT